MSIYIFRHSPGNTVIKNISGTLSILKDINIESPSRALDSIDILINGITSGESPDQTPSSIDTGKIFENLQLTDTDHTFLKNYIHTPGIPYNGHLSKRNVCYIRTFTPIKADIQTNSDRKETVYASQAIQAHMVDGKLAWA